MIGISLQFVAMLYMAIFLMIDQQVDDLEEQSQSQKNAATGALVMMYVDSPRHFASFADLFSHSYLSGFGWAMGWNCIQYLINSEIYPLRLRAISGSFAMTFHFVNRQCFRLVQLLMLPC